MTTYSNTSDFSFKAGRRVAGRVGAVALLVTLVAMLLGGFIAAGVTSYEGPSGASAQQTTGTVTNVESRTIPAKVGKVTTFSTKYTSTVDFGEHGTLTVSGKHAEGDEVTRWVAASGEFSEYDPTVETKLGPNGPLYVIIAVVGLVGLFVMGAVYLAKTTK